ncbi:hypothetical protein PoB_003347000 [Plakobranchus ocellatus]|uniref:Uncharacterized protein n=1 Tax=Plakobranchus ocellatus TaxID=259542 RepID=A0AAV4AI04_9GAST|nr:hypothetical protein PoB_003347000 [Plakobranchus ocellatus]
MASPQQGDLRLPGPPSGQGAGAVARTRDRRVSADLRTDYNQLFILTFALEKRFSVSSDDHHITMQMVRGVDTCPDISGGTQSLGVKAANFYIARI